MERCYLLITEKLFFLKFSVIGNTVFFWVKKLMERWYLLVNGKFLFWTFRWWEIRSLFQPKSWWKDDVYFVFLSFPRDSGTWETWFFVQCLQWLECLSCYMCGHTFTVKFPPDVHNYTGLNALVSSFPQFTIAPQNKLILGWKPHWSAKMKKKK